MEPHSQRLRKPKYLFPYLPWVALLEMVLVFFFCQKLIKCYLGITFITTHNSCFFLSVEGSYFDRFFKSTASMDPFEVVYDLTMSYFSLLAYL